MVFFTHWNLKQLLEVNFYIILLNGGKNHIMVPEAHFFVKVEELSHFFFCEVTVKLFVKLALLLNTVFELYLRKIPSQTMLHVCTHVVSM